MVCCIMATKNHRGRKGVLSHPITFYPSLVHEGRRNLQLEACPFMNCLCVKQFVVESYGRTSLWCLQALCELLLPASLAHHVS